MNYKDKFQDKDKNINLYNMDCMELLKNTEDNYFDLAIVDPPYGIKRSGQRKQVYKGVKSKHNKKYYKDKEWDKEIPKKEYFKELKRVSKNQIIWGANYFIENLKNTSCFIFWDKGQKLNQADGEIAYCSIQKPIRSITINRAFISQKGGSIHPTQKPVKLYEWLLQNYAKEGDKILDTHLGSGSIAIACNRLKYELTACELDTEYFEASVKRYKEQTSQIQMF
jgi:site-specific DNA-methyltransferase (adenine-specific)